jgi:hypothetical protein
MILLLNGRGVIRDEFSKEKKDDALAYLLDSLFNFVQKDILVHLIEIIKYHFLISFMRLLNTL